MVRRLAASVNAWHGVPSTVLRPGSGQYRVCAPNDGTAPKVRHLSTMPIGMGTEY